jgi:hypothetical protein
LVITTAATVGYGDLTLANHSLAIVLIYCSWVILLILLPLSNFLVYKFPAIKSFFPKHALFFLWKILCSPWNGIVYVLIYFRVGTVHYYVVPVNYNVKLTSSPTKLFASVVVQELFCPFYARDKGIHPYKSVDNPAPRPDNTSAL